jgi:signal transduction histidine kinase
MTQAVKNERLAIRQKLIDSYTNRAQEIFFKNLQVFINDQNEFSALVIYDQNDKIIYPVRQDTKIIYSSQAVQKIWKLEFSDANYAGAIKEYEKISQFSSNPAETYEAKMGQIRCLNKQGKTDDAIKTYYESAYILRESTAEQAAKAKLMLLNLYSKVNHKDLLKELQNQLSNIPKADIPTETQVFILEELIILAEKSGLAENLKTEIQAAQKIIDSGSISLMAADYLENRSDLKSFSQGVFWKIEGRQPVYGIYLKNSGGNRLELLTSEKMSQFWQKSVDDFTDKLVFCRIYDDKGKQVAGAETIEGEIFSTLNLKNYFAGWKTELYLRSGVFKEAADKKMFIYIWVASIVIVLMLASTLLASRAVLKQAKLNKLKNDFIATVSHELKTPLSSMRVLVDTLLEGRCENQQQQTEYLQLISKENVRLSRLIDNFLTFSRMERNKQAFDFAPASPTQIAKAAAEAVQTKFNKENCKFIVTINDNLPSITADKDAMVTVLVNLLDNAYKYSYNDKQIELKAFTENNLVCFSVKDNGIGLTRRQMKKIFDRFYQVDSSLARRVEGTGLGLSIVKFIVDAHKGKINVESKPGKGSIFTITIPTIKI